VPAPEWRDCQSHLPLPLTLYASRPLSRRICPGMGMREAYKVATGDHGKPGATPRGESIRELVPGFRRNSGGKPGTITDPGGPRLPVYAIAGGSRRRGCAGKRCFRGNVARSRAPFPSALGFWRLRAAGGTGHSTGMRPVTSASRCVREPAYNMARSVHDWHMTEKPMHRGGAVNLAELERLAVAASPGPCRPGSKGGTAPAARRSSRPRLRTFTPVWLLAAGSSIRIGKPTRTSSPPLTRLPSWNSSGWSVLFRRRADPV